MRGFSLLEVLFALLALSAGLLSAGQVLFVAAASNSLGRSKGSAAIAAQDLLERLDAAYQQDPLAADLVPGSHGPSRTDVVNPVDGSLLNCYQATWDVLPVPDPRPGKILDAKLVNVKISPSLPGGQVNSKPWMNKILNVSTILSVRAQ